MPDLGGRELLNEWRRLMESMVSTAASAAGRGELRHELLGAAQRQLELVQEVFDGERRLQSELVSRLAAPVDAVFDLLEESSGALQRQAETLQAAGRALEETAGLMKRQAELFERTVTTLRQPAELAKAAAGVGRQGPRSTSARPASNSRGAAKPATRAAKKPGTRPSGE
jgi:methyl-accepting chemotaxis protein